MRINEIIIKIDRDTITIDTLNNPVKSIILLCICKPQILFIIICYVMIYLFFSILIISYIYNYLTSHSYFIPNWIYKIYNKNYYISILKDTLAANLFYLKESFNEISKKYICGCR